MLLKFQFQVSVFDSGEPSYKAFADVSIIVTRNPNAPQFEKASYSETIQQTLRVGSLVVNTTAFDFDGVSHFKIHHYPVYAFIWIYMY